jgi:hypothetical protein
VIPFSLDFGMLAAALVLMIVALIPRPMSMLNEQYTEESVWRLVVLLGLGLLALFGAAFPYYIVGRRSIEAVGFMSRDNAIFLLPIGWISAGLFYFLLSVGTFFRRSRGPAGKFPWQRVVVGIIAAIVVAQSLANWRNHADWQAHYAYYRSVVEKVARDELIQGASVIEVVDRLPGDRTLKTWKYPTSIWTKIIAGAFGETTRLAVPFSPENGKFYTLAEIDQRIVETEVEFMLEEIELGGPQVRLVVEPGSGAGNPIDLAIEYWRIRFFAPEEMPAFLNSLTRVETESISRS